MTSFETLQDDFLALLEASYDPLMAAREALVRLMADALAAKRPGISGGAGGALLWVTNANDSGVGSLRAALLTPGRRIVAIVAPGVYLNGSAIKLLAGDVTVIGLSDSFVLRREGLIIAAQNGIFANLRIRGDGQSLNPGSQDCISISSQSGQSPANLLITHCDLMWSSDQLLTLADGSNMIVEWCNLSQALHHDNHPQGNHSKGPFLWRNGQDFTLHHNLIAFNADRNPWLSGCRGVEIINNFMYDTGNFLYITPTNGPVQSHIIGNWMVAGVDTFSSKPVAGKFGVRCSDVNVSGPNWAASLGQNYVLDNLGPTRTLSSQDQRAIAPEGRSGPDEWAPLSLTALFPVRTPATPVAQVEVDVLAHVGAWPRDAMGQQVIDKVRLRAAATQSQIIDSPSQVGGWL